MKKFLFVFALFFYAHLANAQCYPLTSGEDIRVVNDSDHDIMVSSVITDPQDDCSLAAYGVNTYLSAHSGPETVPMVGFPSFPPYNSFPNWGVINVLAKIPGTSTYVNHSWKVINTGFSCNDFYAVSPYNYSEYAAGIYYYAPSSTIRLKVTLTPTGCNGQPNELLIENL